MKKLLLGVIVAAGLSFSLPGCGGANKVSSYNTVPTSVLDEFVHMYPGAHDIKWKVKDGLYRAKFEVGHNDMTATFTPAGEFVRANG
jgi:hypothetical protein